MRLKSRIDRKVPKKAGYSFTNLVVDGKRETKEVMKGERRETRDRKSSFMSFMHVSKEVEGEIFDSFERIKEGGGGGG